MVDAVCRFCATVQVPEPELSATVIVPTALSPARQTTRAFPEVGAAQPSVVPMVELAPALALAADWRSDGAVVCPVAVTEPAPVMVADPVTGGGTAATAMLTEA